MPVCHNHWPPGHSPATWGALGRKATSAFLKANTHPLVPSMSLGGQRSQHKNQLKASILHCLCTKCAGNTRTCSAWAGRVTGKCAGFHPFSERGGELTLPTVGGGSLQKNPEAWRSKSDSSPPLPSSGQLGMHSGRAPESPGMWPHQLAPWLSRGAVTKFPG